MRLRIPSGGAAVTLQIMSELVQGTDAWLDARRGIVTASVVGRLVTYGPPEAQSVACPTCEARPNNPCVSRARKEPTAIKSIHPARTEHAAGRPPVFEVADNETSRSLIATLIAERITGWTEDVFVNRDMWRGALSEPYARDAYSRHHAQVTEVGFMRRDEVGWTLGYSPDGVVGDDGLIEVKAPRAKTHVGTILADEVPAFYMPQLQAGLLVSGRVWCDYVSYVGGMPLYRKRVYPDQQWFEAITAACVAFANTAAQTVAEYQERVLGLPQTERIDFNLEVI